jgi:hypothetical protein
MKLLFTFRFFITQSFILMNIQLVLLLDDDEDDEVELDMRKE